MEVTLRLVRGWHRDDEVSDVTIDYDALFIGGEWVSPSSSRTITVTSASTGERIGSVPEAQEPDVDSAVAAARRAFDDPSGWAQWEPARRAAAMESLAVQLEARSEEMARRIGRELGPEAMSVYQQFETIYA